MMTKVRVVMTIMAAVCFTGAGVAEAQMQQIAPQQQAHPQQTDAEAQRTSLLNELRSLQERIGKVQEELTAIAQKAVDENPGLLEMHSSLTSIYQSKLSEYGFPSEEEMQKLQAMQHNLQSGNIPEDERQQLTQQFHAEVAKLQEAQQKAQNDPEVQKKQAEFNQARLEAMQKVNPKTMDLQRKNEQLQSEINRLQQSLQATMQQVPRH